MCNLVEREYEVFGGIGRMRDLEEWGDEG